jgi:hypothetical protein
MKKVVKITESVLEDIIGKVINEIYNEDEVNRILDKISQNGIQSITRAEKMTLDNSFNKDYSTRQELIRQIKQLVDLFEGNITAVDLGADSPIVLREENGEMHVLDAFQPDGILISIYQGNDYEEELGQVTLPYENMVTDNLDEILDILQDFANDKNIAN